MQRIPTTIYLTLLLLFAAAVVRAQGILIPDPSSRVLPHPRPFVVTLHQVDVSIDNQAARTIVRQTYENQSRVDLEGVYIFPVPAGASVTDFSMWMNGEKVSGETLDAAEAARIYRDIVRRMKDPGLLEYLGQDMFRARVYPIPARGRVQIEIAFDQVLAFDSGLVEYVYPVHPVCPGLVAYAQPVQPVRDHPRNRGVFSIAVNIDSDTPIKSLYSPTHDIDRVISGRKASCSYESDEPGGPGEFVLYYGLSEQDVGLTLLSCGRTARGHDDRGYFALLLSPGRLEEPRETSGKDIVFVIDRSGSMKGGKIEQAKGAARFCLQSLNEKDRFGIITFATGVDRFERGLTENTPNAVKRALRFVDGISARGGTDINDALLEALDIEPSSRPQMIIFLTDGAPTAGETNVDRILRNIESTNTGGVRIFVFGVGYDVNTMLLDKLALDNRGTVAYVKPQEDIEIKVLSFYSKVERPVLSDISLDFGAVKVFDVYPRELPDLFDGSQVVVFGRFERGGETGVKLTGQVGDRRAEYVYDARFETRDGGRGKNFIPRLWASRKIAYLIEEIRLHGENRELVDEIVALSLEHGIVTPYTSYLILEDDRWAGVTRPIYEKILREQPSGVDLGQVMTRESGDAAVILSSDIAESKAKSVVDQPATNDLRRVDGKTFYLSDGVWTDSEYEEGSETTDIVFLSDEYFALIDVHPETAKYLALGDKVIFVYDGAAYRVTTD